MLEVGNWGRIFDHSVASSLWLFRWRSSSVIATVVRSVIVYQIGDQRDSYKVALTAFKVAIGVCDVGAKDHSVKESLHLICVNRDESELRFNGLERGS